MRKHIQKWLTRIKYALLGFLLLGIFGVYYITHDDYAKNKIYDLAHHFFKQEHGCVFSGTVQSISLFPPRVVIDNLSLQKEDDTDWSIHVNRATLKFHVFDLLKKRQIGYDLELDGVHLHERFESMPQKIAQFLGGMAAGDDAFLDLKKIHIVHGTLVGRHKQQPLSLRIQYAGLVSLQKHGVTIALYTEDGSVEYGDLTLCENGAGSVHVYVPITNVEKGCEATAALKFDVPELLEKNVQIALGLYNGIATLEIHDENQDVLLDPITCNIFTAGMPCEIHGSTSLQKLQHKPLFRHVGLADCAGLVKIFVQCNLENVLDTLQGNFSLYNAQYNGQQLGEYIEIDWKQIDQALYQAQIAVDEQPWFIMQGGYKDLYTWDIDIRNEQELSIPSTYWQIPSKNWRTRVQTTDSQLNMSYTLALFSKKLQEQFVLQGSGVITGETIDFHALCGEHGKITVGGSPQQFPYISAIDYAWKDNTVASMKRDGDFINGYIDGKTVRAMFEKGQQFVVSQDGTLVFDGKIRDTSVFGKIALQDAHVRIPYLYNVIQDASLEYAVTLWPLQVHVRNLDTHLYEGQVTSSYMWFQSANKEQLYAPLIFDNVLISWQKGLSGVISGYSLAQKTAKQPMRIFADIVLESADLRGNIFSESFVQSLTDRFVGQSLDKSYPYELYITTKDPITIATSFLQAKADMHVHAYSKQSDHYLQGEINIQQGGTFNFPYKSLSIVEGKVSFTQDHSFDPLLHVIAKGRIKRYDITMRVSGSVQAPTVSFASVPYLPEQQIVSLLLFGSDDDSIAIMPDFVKTQLQDIIFGPAVSESRLESRFNRLLEPLKHVRFYPKFANQQGRGGMRGVVEIEANERLRGKIDSNFFQLEDTRFEVDYDVTDELTARAVRDGPATYGAEVELRWKW